MSNLDQIKNDIIHIVGIGGIGMSAIAIILKSMGFNVQGSDMNENANTKELKEKGIKVFIGQKGENLENIKLLVKSSAIKDSNPEIIEAKKLGIKIVKRSVMLADILKTGKAICVSGTHGKTTTTSMVYSLFENTDIDATVINGGIINSIGTNAKHGNNEWIITESDESDGTFIELPAHIGIVTNIDAEHLEHYGSYENLLNSFKKFVDNISDKGFAVICNDDSELQRIATETKSKLITYSIDNESNVKAHNIRYENGNSIFDIEITGIDYSEKQIKNIKLPFIGNHNISNSLAAISVGIGLNFDANIIKTGFEGFKGVKRRFSKVGEFEGVTIIDDYAHHPKEIKATLKMAKQVVGEGGGEVIAVVQPHRYSRLRDLFEGFSSCFEDADKVIVTDIYSAGENVIEGYSKDSLVEAIKGKGHNCVKALSSDAKLAGALKSLTKSGDIVACMGAGDISKMANDLPGKLQNLK